MTYQFDRSRFAETNTLPQQLAKILAELSEVYQALADGESEERVLEELLDVYHAVETGLWIVERQNGPGFVQTARDGVAKKNRERGFYERYHHDT